MINADDALIFLDPANRIAGEIVGSRNVGKRQKLCYIVRDNWVDRNLIVGIGISANRVNQLTGIESGVWVDCSGEQAAEITFPFRWAEYRQHRRFLPFDAPCPLIRGKEKSLVLVDGSANRSAK